FLAVGDVDADGCGDLIVGGGPQGGPRVLVLSGALLAVRNVAGAQAAPLANFFAGDPATRGGIHVAAKDLGGDSLADILAGSGELAADRLSVYLGKNLAPGTAPTADQDLTPCGGQELTLSVFVG